MDESRYSGPPIYVTTENSFYLGWQTQLFCRSAFQVTDENPTVVVAADQDTLLPLFYQLADDGCEIIQHRSNLNHSCGIYPPQNELFSLKAIGEKHSSKEGTFLLCEADMLFLKRPTKHGGLTGQNYSYMDYSQERLRDVLQNWGLAQAPSLLNELYSVGVPYEIPFSAASDIADRWIEVLKQFTSLEWVDIMYAFGVALATLRMPITTIDDVCFNGSSDAPCYGSILHYCNGDSAWCKRDYVSRHPCEDVSGIIQNVKPNTVLSEIMEQMLVCQPSSRR